MNEAALSHLDPEGGARMVDVGTKGATRRTAITRAEILMNPQTFELLKSGGLKKGDAFTAAKIAGIMAAKKTSSLIPLCHPLPIEHIEISFKERAGGGGFIIQTEVTTTAKTGVEMEALTGAAVAALTLYDMAKSSDRAMKISELQLIKKTGGKTDYDSSH